MDTFVTIPGMLHWNRTLVGKDWAKFMYFTCSYMKSFCKALAMLLSLPSNNGNIVSIVTNAFQLEKQIPILPMIKSDARKLLFSSLVWDVAALFGLQIHMQNH